MKQSLKIYCMLALLSGGLMFVRCTGSKQEALDRSIKKALRQEPGISQDEFVQIKNLIQEDEELITKYTNDSLIKQYILTIAEALGKAKRNPIALPVTVDTGAADESEKFQANELHFFYENSASMDGYLKGNSKFTGFVLDFLAKSDLNKDQISLYYINREAYLVDTNIIKEYQDFLKPSNVKEVGGKGRANSEINRILGIVADTVVKKDNRIGVVISDYIYSIDGRNISELLNLQKSTTTTNLKKLGEKDFAILVIRLESEFEGWYYNMLNKGTRINDKERPVYVWVMGPKNKLMDFLERYDVLNSKAYRNHFMLLKGDLPAPYYTILPRTCKEGNFERTDRSSKKILSICNVECNRNDLFQFGLAVDFSKYPIADSTLTDTSSYRIVTESGNNLKVTAVLPIESIEHNDKEYRGKATHILRISTAKVSKGTQRVNVQMKKSIPKWVQKYSTECDTTETLRKGKTFGFSYLINGAKTVFDYKNDSYYFSLPITIKR